MTVHDQLVRDWLHQLSREITKARAALAPRDEIDLLLHVDSMLRGFWGAVNPGPRRHLT
ncbi:hypothetical protein ACFQ0K_10170 [Nocardioides caeni]|uniref:hypothetical protein n=1 Tax=Nocardioides caeni TaxID=574700 RepID=UPI0013053C30|nr:hypothetical protein [Nocardioides caeni]